MKPVFDLNGLIVAPLFMLLVFCAGCSNQNKMTPQNPSPMVDFIRPHERVDGSGCVGERMKLEGIFESAIDMFVPAHILENDTVDLLMHFHGNPKVTEWMGCMDQEKFVIITINLGSGSSRYEKPLLNNEISAKLFETVINVLFKDHGVTIDNTIVSGFSAGYGAIRALLNSKQYFDQIDGVVLLDGLHTDYMPDKMSMAKGGKLNVSKLDPFLKYAKEAIMRNKRFVFTHSSIFPGTYASTTECADYLIKELGLTRTPTLQQGPVGMQQVGSTEKGGLRILAFAGNTAPDHVDHLHGLSYFVHLLLE